MNCNTHETLNITMGTDIVLNDTLLFDGETFDPALSTDLVSNLVSGTGKRTPLEVEAADGILIVSIPWVDGRNAGLYGLEVTGKCNGKKWATYADSLIYYTRPTRPGASEVGVESDYYDITQVVAFRFSASPIEKATASIDGGVGTPTVDVDYDGHTLDFDFHDMKGETGSRGNGITSIEQTQASTLSGGVNIVKIKTDEDPDGVDIEIRNGNQGATVIHGAGDLVLDTEVGQSPTKGMTQKAVTDLARAGMIKVTTTETPTLQYYHVGDVYSYYVDGETGAITYWQGGTTKTVEIDLTPDMTKIKYKASAYNDPEKGGYAFVDDNDNYVSGAITTESGDIEIPVVAAYTQGARKFRCCRKTQSTPPDFELTYTKENYHWPTVYDELGTHADGWMTQKSVNEQFGKVDSEFGKVWGYTMLNQIMRIGTANPSVRFLQDFADGDEGCCEIVNVADTDSPFADLLGHMTKLVDTGSSTSTCYRYENAISSSAKRTNRPTKIFIAFWINEDDFANFQSNTYAPNPSFRDSAGNIQTIYYGTKGVIGMAVGASYGPLTSDGNIFSATYYVKHMAKVGKWHQMGLFLSAITWKNSNKWEYGINLSGTFSRWNQIRLVNYQIVEGDDIPSGVIVLQDVGGTMTGYDGGMTGMKQEIQGIDSRVDVLEADYDKREPSTFHYSTANDATSYIRSRFNATKDIKANFQVKRAAVFCNTNPCFSFVNVELITRATGESVIIHTNSDDIAPTRYGSSYIGANHGQSDIKVVGVSAHGKTYADIGSIWSMGGNTYTLVGIYSNDALYLLGENTKSYPDFQFRQAGVGTYTHVSGATHSDSFVVVSGQVYNGQMKPAMKIASRAVYVDGEEITAGGDYKCRRVDICENYDVLNPASVLDKIKEGVGTFTANPDFAALGAEKLARVSLVYTYDGAGKWFIGETLSFYDSARVRTFQVPQAAAIKNSNSKLYIPKTLPVGDKDYRTPQDFTTAPSSEINFTSAYWETPQSPPDRIVESMDLAGFSTGYILDCGIAPQRGSSIEDSAIKYATTKKIYIHGKDVNPSTPNVQEGDTISAVVYRIYHDASAFNANGVILQNVFEYAGKLYIYADYSASGYYDIAIPGKYLGKTVEVLESKNVTVVNEMAASRILVKATVGTNDVNAYLVAQIK